jgi:hypothetical protein
MRSIQVSKQREPPRIVISCLGKCRPLPLPVLPTDMLMLTKLAGLNPLGPGPRAVDEALGGLLTELIKQNSFAGELGRLVLADLKENAADANAPRGQITLVGLGEPGKFDQVVLRSVFRLFLAHAVRRRMRHAVIPVVIRGLPRGRLTYHQAGHALRLAVEDLCSGGNCSRLQEIEVVARTPRARRLLERSTICTKKEAAMASNTDTPNQNIEVPYKVQVAEFLGSYGALLHAARREKDLAEWNFQQHSSEENRNELLAAEKAKQTAAGDALAYDILCGLLQDKHFEKLDRQSRRSLQIAAELYSRNVPRATDAPRFQALREELDARTVELIRIKAAAADTSELALQIPDGHGKPFSDLVRDLVIDRNRLARMRGFDNYYLMRMDEANMDFVLMRQLLASLKVALDILQPRISFIAAHGPKAVSLDRLAERVVDARTLLLRTAELIGVPSTAIDAILAASDLYPRPEKDKFWFLSQIDPPFDVRAHTNIHKYPEKLSAQDLKNQLLHEIFGHGVDCRSIDPNLQPLLRQLDSFTAEAVAKLSEELVFEPRWLRHVIGIKGNELHILEPQLWRLQLDLTVRNLRHNSAIVDFEVEMYRDPTQDLDAAYARAWAWALNEQAADFRVALGSWAVDVPHFLSYPAYCHNYLLGAALSSQIRQSLRRRFGTYASRRTGPFMAKHRSSGLLYTADEKIARITGRPLDVQDLLAELNRLVTVLERESQRTAVA